jgi:hypothetical protein
MALQRRVCSIASTGLVSATDGPGWACSRTGVGTFVMTFPGTLAVAGAALCIIVCPTGGRDPLWARFSNNSTTGTTVGIYSSTGVLTDSGFSFEMCADFL